MSLSSKHWLKVSFSIVIKSNKLSILRIPSSQNFSLDPAIEGAIAYKKLVRCSEVNVVSIVIAWEFDWSENSGVGNWGTVDFFWAGE